MFHTFCKNEHCPLCVTTIFSLKSVVYGVHPLMSSLIKISFSPIGGTEPNEPDKYSNDYIHIIHIYICIYIYIVMWISEM